MIWTVLWPVLWQVFFFFFSPKDLSAHPSQFSISDFALSHTRAWTLLWRASRLHTKPWRTTLYRMKNPTSWPTWEADTEELQDWMMLNKSCTKITAAMAAVVVIIVMTTIIKVCLIALCVCLSFWLLGLDCSPEHQPSSWQLQTPPKTVSLHFLYDALLIYTLKNSCCWSEFCL